MWAHPYPLSLIPSTSIQEKLEEAAKAQVRRLCTPKTRRVGLTVPSWVIDEFKSRPKAETARLLMQCNFDKDRFLFYCIFSKMIKILTYMLNDQFTFYSSWILNLYIIK